MTPSIYLLDCQTIWKEIKVRWKTIAQTEMERQNVKRKTWHDKQNNNKDTTTNRKNVFLTSIVLSFDMEEGHTCKQPLTKNKRKNYHPSFVPSFFPPFSFLPSFLPSILPSFLSSLGFFEFSQPQGEGLTGGIDGGGGKGRKKSTHEYS